MKKASPFLCALTVAAIVHAQVDKAPFNDSIRMADLKADLFFLAGDGFKGRLVGTPENALAAEFVRSRFERAGLKPAGADGSFIQPVNLMVATLGDENLLEITATDGTALRHQPKQDFYPHRFSASGHVRAPLVYAGFGITHAALSYNDYVAERVKGRVVLILEHEPGERDPSSPFDGVVTAEAAVPIKKALAAQEHGAVGVLFVADVHNHPSDTNFEAQAHAYWPPETPRIDRFTLAAWADQVRIPVAQVSPALAATLVRSTARSLADLSRAAETPRGFQPIPLDGITVALTTSVDRDVVPDQNVLGYIEGTDARLKEEVVIVSAHYDHEGVDGARIFNGADDDGSGTVGLIEIAEAYALAAQANQRPRRTVLFASWGAEERGLLGAWAYTEQPTWPLERTVAVLNMDMIGRNEEVPVGGGGRFRGLDVQTAESNRNAVNILGYSRTPDLGEAVQRANKAHGLELKLRYDNNASNLLRRSDHWPFLQRGVPAVWFHTGLHPDYHTQYDRPEKINYEKMEKIARLVHHASWMLANQDGRPRMAGRPGTE
jgi:hypothetical protein